MRLAAAGAGHNLTLFLLLWLVGFTGLGRLFWYDRTEAGRVVQTVSPVCLAVPVLGVTDRRVHRYMATSSLET